MQTLHLFAGAGGGLLADLILGHQPIGAVEFDPYCCAVLRERAADGWFPGLHVHEGDVRLFDPSGYAGRVDCIHAGFPCQPHSVAGKRAGEADERNLWPDTKRIIGELRPRYALLENVPGIFATGYVWTVLGDLAEMGYDARWAIVSAADVGAPHLRERWWCLAEMADASGGRCGGTQDGKVQQSGRAEVVSASINPDTNSQRQQKYSERHGSTPRTRKTPQRHHACGLHKIVANTTGLSEREQTDKINAITKSRETRPESVCGRERLPDAILERLEREQQSGATSRPAHGPGHGCNPGWWQVEPDVGRVVDGLAARVDRLKALGNGQVALTAAFAWKLLGGP